LTWDDVGALLQEADVPRRSRLIQIAKNTVKQAKADWPKLLEGAPDDMRRTIAERLNGGLP
jgi:serine/threonine-protein kinase HipA